MGKHLFVLSFFSLFSTLVMAQKEVTISGKIIDKETNQPLEYATIVFFNKNENKIKTGGITDTKGRFSIPVPVGLYNITVEYISFKTITIADKKITKSENIGSYSLEIDTESLGEVEIIAERTTVEIKLDKKIYNVGKDLTVSGGSVTDVLDNVPSVSVDAEGSVALRGNDNVRILINGKPSGLVGLNSTEALQQLPADAIEKVEVITSPSARYEAEGTGGIINIILRRSKLLGFNGSISTNVGHPDAAGISGNINYRTGNVNIFNTTSYRYNESFGRWYNAVKYFDDTPDLDEKRNWTDTKKGITTNTGVEWYITDSASLTNAIVFSDNSSYNNSINNLVQLDKTTNETNKSVRRDPENGESNTFQYTLNFTKNFKTDGHKFSFDFQFENSNNDRFSLINVDGINTDILNNWEDGKQILVQTDYILPLGENSQIEMGYRGDFTTTETDYQVSLLNEDTNLFEYNTNLSNLFNFKQYINAAYFQFGSKIDEFSYLLGLRMEHTKNILDQPTSGDFKRKNLTGLFPTINLSYKFSEDESMTIGYNRRLRRPRGFMLNPFPSRSSLTNVFQGNPDLNPTYSSVFDIGYLNRLGKFTLSSSIYYSNSTEVMTFVSRNTGETVTINGEEFPVIERGPVNLATDNRYGFEFNLNFSPSRKWRINSDFNIYKLERNGEYEGINLDANNLTWNARLTNKLTLPYAIDWQTNLNYRGPSVDSQNNRQASGTVNTALSKDILKEKASIAFNIKDVFNSGVYRNNITAETFTAHQEVQRRGGTTYNLSFTYRFNQQKKKERSGGGYGDGGDNIEM